MVSQPSKALLAALIAALVLAAPASASVRMVDKWGQFGSGPGQFSSPQDVAVDGDGNVFVLDRSNARVQRFTADGEFVKAWGSGGSAPGRFFQPFGLDARGGAVYVADSGNNRIQRFDINGVLTGVIGSPGFGPGELSFPTDVEVEASGNVVVSDTGNFRVQRFGADGAALGSWGGFGTAPGEFVAPWGLAVDGAGDVYVTDQGAGVVQKFTSAGTHLATFGGDGTIVQGFGVAVHPDGDVFVADTASSSVQRFAADTSLIETVAVPGTADGEVLAPFGMDVDDDGRIYVADTGNNRVQVLVIDEPPVLSVPSDISVDAVSPAGAPVPFTVSATDDFDPSPSVSCEPASGSTFAIGTTTVACTASDAAGNVSTGGFVVTVRSAAEQLGDLVDLIGSYDLGPRGANVELGAHLNQVLRSLENGQPGKACRELSTFSKHVGTRKLSQSQAGELTTDADRIGDVLGCP